MRRLCTLALVLTGIAIVVVRHVLELSGERRTLSTLGLTLFAALMTVVLLFTVRGRWRAAARTAATLMLVAGLAIPVLFRVRGLTGDFFPVLEYRFAPKPDTTLPALPGTRDEAAPPVEQAAEAETDPGVEATGSAAESLPDSAASDAEAVPAADTEPAPVRDTPAPAAVARAGADVSFPQFLGPGRTGIIPDVRIARDWSTRPPKAIWRIPVGAGWSGFVFDRGLAITQEQRGGDEMVVAYELLTGRPVWSHRDRVRYESVIAGDGPRATPTIAGPYVVTLGATGVLNVLEFETGRRVWTKHIAEDASAPTPEWGRSGSPLVLDGKVIVSAGGPDGQSVVAYDLKTGARVWAGGTSTAGYAAPTLLTLLGRPQVVVFNSDSLAGHDPQTGALLWSQPWPKQAPNVAMPMRVADDLVLASTGYGMGSKLVRLAASGDAIEPSVVWESLRLKAKFTNPVLHEGFVYGLDDGVLTCIDVETGERRWKAGRYGHGQTLLAGDVLLVTTEDGAVVLVEPTPERHQEIARFTAFDAKMWNPPALAGKYLLLRTDKEAALFELPQ
ncbi:MAG TPA: PQQ-binding-like beta-propeller repeat protein [Vicinamibacterales bacterium]